MLCLESSFSDVCVTKLWQLCSCECYLGFYEIVVMCLKSNFSDVCVRESCGNWVLGSAILGFVGLLCYV